MKSPNLTALIVLAGPALGRPSCSSSIGASNADTSYTLLFQNNLNLTDDVNHVGAILLDPMTRAGAARGCSALNEQLLPWPAIKKHEDDFVKQLSYQEYAGRANARQQYWIGDGTVFVLPEEGRLERSGSYGDSHTLPVLCTQSSNNGQPSAAASSSNLISVSSDGNKFVGFRNQKSFRFQGMRFAEPPSRFEYASLYSPPKGETINATVYGEQCIQTGSGGSEDCLFINIQTPYIPKAGSKKDLRPVLFWIYGGGFTGGVGSAGDSDGGQLASREDIVTVTMNYRLSTIGFLAVPGTDVKGNYGIADQNVALDWTVKNIAKFGGDPNQITLNGGSAGAASVRAQLGSPKSIGKFQGAIAMSSLGGGADLGVPAGDYATQYSAYPTIEGSYNLSSDLFAEAGCNQKGHQAQVNCIKKVDAATLVNLPTVARYVVQDGTYVNTPELIVRGRNPNTAHVPIIFGNAENDGASFCLFPSAENDTEVKGIEESLGISKYYAQSIVDSGLFPYYDSGNQSLDTFNVSQRVSTDIQFRCIDQASAYAGAVTGAFKRAYYYMSVRTQCPGYNPDNLSCPGPSPGYPHGSPYAPYFRLHGSDQASAFGYLYVIRDPKDLFAIQLSLSYYGTFIKTGQPNADPGYLRARGYSDVLRAEQDTGPWEPIKDANGPIRLIDYPSKPSPFIDVPQCAFLNYSLSYYLDRDYSSGRGGLKLK